jgi:hypothetical protein
MAFKKGESGNPAGRPVGSYTRQLTALRQAADEILPSLLEKAKAGDMEAIRLIIDRAVPKLKPVTPAEAFSLPEGSLLSQVQAVLKGVNDEALTLSAAGEIVNIIATAAKVEELESIKAELNSLKRTLGRRRN